MYHIYLSTNICPDISLIMFISVKFLCILWRSLQFCEFHGKELLQISQLEVLYTLPDP